jgi:NAD(P)-dependent dehydrogenase (short-subunit alcohol dehydrogenase family)
LRIIEMISTDERIAIVTGANRGIGFETCRQLSQMGILTILTSRDESRGKAALQSLLKESENLLYHQLDVSDIESITQLESFIREKFDRCDILINNAGVYLDRGRSIFEVPLNEINETMETNFYGALNMCRTFLPFMRKHQYGRIVNVSSGMGSISTLSGYSAAYRLSKVLLNAMTLIMAKEISDRNIKINAMIPGWVRSDMGGPSAPRGLAQGADTIVWLATLPADGPTGGYFEDRKPVPW